MVSGRQRRFQPQANLVASAADLRPVKFSISKIQTSHDKRLRKDFGIAQASPYLPQPQVDLSVTRPDSCMERNIPRTRHCMQHHLAPGNTKSLGNTRILASPGRMNKRPADRAGRRAPPFPYADTALLTSSPRSRVPRNRRQLRSGLERAGKPAPPASFDIGWERPVARNATVVRGVERERKRSSDARGWCRVGAAWRGHLAVWERRCIRDRRLL